MPRAASPGQPFIEDPIEVSNCDEVIISWKAPMNGGEGLTAFRIKYSASHIKGVKRTTPPADDMVIVQTIADPEARRASIRGLLPGTTYSFGTGDCGQLGHGGSVHFLLLLPTLLLNTPVRYRNKRDVDILHIVFYPD